MIRSTTATPTSASPNCARFKISGTRARRIYKRETDAQA